MRENYKIIDISYSDITDIMLNCQKQGDRLVQMHAVSIPSGAILYYSVSTGDNEFVTYKTQVSDDVVLPSISSIYPNAILYENEMKELFGVNIDCISLDYNNRLYRINVETPFKKPAKEGE